MKSDPSVRVTLRQVAQAAGVSVATVSLALRGDPRITPGTRREVEAKARELGYRPDPAVSAFMLGLRRGQPATARANIAILPTIAELTPGGQPYGRAIRAGAVQHAQERGYPVIDVGLKQHGRRLGQVLYARGVSGVILLPMPEPRDLTQLLDWSAVSVVATSFSVLAPRMHLVVPNHFANLQQSIDQLLARGYRRLGLLLSGPGFLERVNRTYLAAVALHHRQAGADAIEPLVVEGARHIPGALPGWFAVQQPDVILTNNAPAVAQVLRSIGMMVPADVGVMDLGAEHPETFAGLEQMPRALGEEAAFRVISMMHRGERGVPALPFISMLEGRFLSGPSLRPKRSAAKGETGRARS